MKYLHTHHAFPVMEHSDQEEGEAAAAPSQKVAADAAVNVDSGDPAPARDTANGVVVPIINQWSGWFGLSLIDSSTISYFPLTGTNDKKPLDIKYVDFSNNDILEQYRNFTVYEPHRENSQYKLNPGAIRPDWFYFYLNDQNVLYYAEDEKATLILGSMIVKEANLVALKRKECTLIKGSPTQTWLLCGDNGTCDTILKTKIAKITNQKWKGCADDIPAAANCTAIAKVVQQEIQPIMLIPRPSPDCKYDFDYDGHGATWGCNCDKGITQSPINIPVSDPLQKLDEAITFQYEFLKMVDMEFIYDRGLLRIRPKNMDDQSKGFGQMTGPDGTIFRAEEIQFHTPGEHQLNGQTIDLEVQVVHTVITGPRFNFTAGYQAILSFPYKKKAGAMKDVFKRFNYLNYPNPKENVAHDWIDEELNVLQFLHDSKSDVKSVKPFSYYYYYGSNTQPPCAENVVWVVVDEELYLSTTLIYFLRAALEVPKKTAPRIDPDEGNNRMIQKTNDRLIQYFDRYSLPSLGGDTQKKEQKNIDIDAHFERLDSKDPFYFYYDYPQPSNLDQQFLVPKEELIKLGLVTPVTVKKPPFQKHNPLV